MQTDPTIFKSDLKNAYYSFGMFIKHENPICLQGYYLFRKEVVSAVCLQFESLPIVNSDPEAMVVSDPSFHQR